MVELTTMMEMLNPRSKSALSRRVEKIYDSLSDTLVSSDTEMLDGRTQRDILHDAISQAVDRLDDNASEDDVRKYVIARYNAIRKGLRIRNRYNKQYADN